MDGEIKIIDIHPAGRKTKEQSNRTAKRREAYRRERGLKMSALTENPNRRNGTLAIHAGYLDEMFQLSQDPMTPEEFDEYMKLDNDDIDLSEVLSKIPDFTGRVLFADENEDAAEQRGMT